MAAKEVKVPDIGDYKNVDVIEVNVKPGDSIQAEDPIVTLETDKATMEVPAPFAGVVKDVKVKEGSKVSEGDLLITVEAEGEAATEDKAEAPAEPKAEEKAVEKTEEAPKAEKKPAASGGTQEVKVPDIGDYKNVDIIEVNVSVGDTVTKEQPLITLETDKATMEVPSPADGKVKDIKVKEGGKVSQGDVILTLEGSGGTEAPAAKAETPEEQPAAAKEEKAPAPAEKPAEQKEAAPSADADADLYASPSVRRLVREFDLDVSKITASGRKGRLTKEDVQSYVKNAMQSGGAVTSGGASLGLLPDPIVDFAKFGEVETQPLSRIKKISGANLARNWVRVPHIFFFEDADITDLEAFRAAKKQEAEKAGVKLTPVPFLVKAVAKALTKFPNVNSSLSADGQNQVLKKYVHVGVAVDTPNGLMVPVIRDADKKSILEIGADLMALIQKARDGKLSGADMQGGCFTISSLGGIGTTGFTPIVNMPEVAILGVSKAAMKPVYDESTGGFVARLMMPLSLSVDHRVVDGAEAGQFIVAVAKYLSDLKEILL